MDHGISRLIARTGYLERVGIDTRESVRRSHCHNRYELMIGRPTACNQRRASRKSRVDFYRYSRQRALAEQYQAIQTGLFDAANKALGVGIQVRRSWWQLDRLDAGCFEHAEKLSGEQRITVMDQVALTCEDAVDNIAADSEP